MATASASVFYATAVPALARGTRQASQLKHLRQSRVTETPPAPDLFETPADTQARRALLPTRFRARCCSPAAAPCLPGSAEPQEAQRGREPLDPGHVTAASTGSGRPLSASHRLPHGKHERLATLNSGDHITPFSRNYISNEGVRVNRGSL